MSDLPRVALIITGGTIDSVGKDRLDLAWYIEAGKRLNTGELLDQLPELAIHRVAPDSKPWEELDAETRNKKIHQAKRRLNDEVASAMTVSMLGERKEKEEIIKWLREVGNQIGR